MNKENAKRIYIVFFMFCVYGLFLAPYNITIFELFKKSNTDIKKIYLLSAVLFVFVFLFVYRIKIIKLLKKELFYSVFTVVLFSEFFINSLESELFYKVFLLAMGDIIIINLGFVVNVQLTDSPCLLESGKLLLEHSNSLEKVSLEKIKYKE